jgi:hypothetical protein
MTDNISTFPQCKPVGCRAARMLKLKKPAHHEDGRAQGEHIVNCKLSYRVTSNTNNAAASEQRQVS